MTNYPEVIQEMKVKSRASNAEDDSTTPDTLGFVGVILAIAGMSDLPLGARIPFLLASSVSITKSFVQRNDWPVWIRWWLSIAANSLFVLAAWSFIQNAFPAK